MGKKSLRHRAKAVSEAVLTDKETGDGEAQDARDWVQQADICCQEARLAIRMKRLGAACGLFETAQNLLRQAIKSSGNVRTEATEKLSQIATEAAIYSELACYGTRPQSPQAIPVRASVSPRERR